QPADPDHHVGAGDRRERRPSSRRCEGHRQAHHLRYRRNEPDMAVLPGRPLFKSEVKVARHPLRTHTVDIETIGAGGGSIAAVQLGGVLKVGPQSAGANPGPACYDRGGSEPTLTDALVLLGHLNQTALLDGAMPISGARARE